MSLYRSLIIAGFMALNASAASAADGREQGMGNFDDHDQRHLYQGRIRDFDDYYQPYIGVLDVLRYYP
jgi:hypothetical protein